MLLQKIARASHERQAAAQRRLSARDKGLEWADGIALFWHSIALEISLSSHPGVQRLTGKKQQLFQNRFVAFSHPPPPRAAKNIIGHFFTIKITFLAPAFISPATKYHPASYHPNL